MADPDDTVELTDLEVIQQFSLAVRGAKARRSDVIAALEADLTHLRGGRASAPRAVVAPSKAPTAKAPTAKAPTAKAPTAKAPAAKASARATAKVSAKAPAKKATRSRA
jgi:hypothetical protein